MNLILRDADAARVDTAAQGIRKWEFVASGVASESPYHQWKCAFYLGRGSGGTTYVLRLHDFGDPDEEYEDDEPYIEPVALACDAGGIEVDEVVRTLLEEYRAAGGKYIEEYEDIGPFEIDAAEDE
jgi:hypothetical protein